jgi:hypothetical protein
LDIVIGEGSSVFKLLSSKDESLLIGWDSFLILDLGLHVINSVRGFDIKGNGLSSQGFDEDLHSSSKSEYKMEG